MGEKIFVYTDRPSIEPCTVPESASSNFEQQPASFTYFSYDSWANPIEHFTY